MSTSSVAPSETSSQQPANDPIPATPASPASVQRSHVDVPASTPKTTSKAPSRSAVPAIPVLPALPKSSPKDAKSARAEKPSTSEAAPEVTTEAVATSVVPTEAAGVSAEAEPTTSEAIPEPQPRAPPTSWANLFAKSTTGASGKAAGPNGSVTAATANGHASDGASVATNGAASTLSKTNSSSVAEAIQAYHVGESEKISFLEPRGLINTGNMCYMNSVGFRVSSIPFA